MTNLLPYAICWGVLAIVVIGLALWRRAVSANEDDCVHLSGDAGYIKEQAQMAGRLEAIDKWGKSLTIVLAISGVALGVIYIMQLWDSSSKMSPW